MTTPTPTLSGHAQHQFLAKVLDIDGYWAAWTGGDKSLAVTEQYDGGNPVPDLIPSRGTHSNVVLRRPFKADRDMPVQKTLRAAMNGAGYIKPLVLQPVGRDGKATAQKFLLTGCLLVRIGMPTFDANSETGSTYEIEFRAPRSDVLDAAAT